VENLQPPGKVWKAFLFILENGIGMCYYMSIEIIENTKEAKENYHNMFWGCEDYTLTKEDFVSLLEGKTLAHEDGEYSHTFTLENIQLSGNVEDRYTKDQMNLFLDILNSITRGSEIGSCEINGKKFVVAFGVKEFEK
jgi:hypothetical protein